MAWYRWQGDDLLLNIHLQPDARVDAIVGLHGDRLKIRISAPPADNRANNRLCEYLAQCFAVPKTAVLLEGGHKSRAKRVRIHCPQKLLPAMQRPL